ncbi:MAG: hypothetical protein ACXWCG_10585 [Flavitalea sp.]
MQRKQGVEAIDGIYGRMLEIKRGLNLKLLEFSDTIPATGD